MDSGWIVASLLTGFLAVIIGLASGVNLIVYIGLGVAGLLFFVGNARSW